MREGSAALTVQLGPYQVVQELRGKATHLRRFQAVLPTLGRIVELRGVAENPTAEDRELFHREADELARLDHWALHPVLDRVEVGDAMFYAVPLRIEPTLEGLLTDSSFTFAQRCDVIRQLAEALRACHESDIVLGELDAELVALDRSSGRAHFVNHRFSPPERTAEQLRIQPPDCKPSRQPTKQSDLFRWGCLAYWVLSRGSFPYERRLGEVSGLLGHMPDFPPDLAEVLESCLARSPQERLSDATALHKQLLARWSELSGIEGTLVEKPPEAVAEAGAQTPNFERSLQAMALPQGPEADPRARWVGAGVTMSAALSAFHLVGGSPAISGEELGLIRQSLPQAVAPGDAAESRGPPVDLSKLREDPRLQRLLAARPVQAEAFPRTWERLRRAANSGALPNALNDPTRILGLKETFRQDTRAGLAALNSYLDELAASLAPG